MPFSNMIQETLGTVPGSNLGLAKTKINEAFVAIQNENVFSFQCITGGWYTPGLLGGAAVSGNPGTNFVSPGTITVQPFQTVITGDLVATQTWNAVQTAPLLTQQQIRSPYFSLYSIISQGTNGKIAYASVAISGSGQTPGTYSVPVLDNGGPGNGATLFITVDAGGAVTLAPIVLTAGQGYINPYVEFSEGGSPAQFIVTSFATLTIDRPWMEPPQNNGTYMIYQAYFPAPAGFKRWWNLRDTTNNNSMDWWSKTQVDLANEDAERTIFDEPLYVVPYQIDSRPGSGTLGQMLYELWPHPITNLPYTFMCQANWPALVNPTDAVPFPLTEELLKLRALEMLSLWKEGQKGDEMERGSGANWQFLVGAYRAEYSNRLKECRNMDRHLMDLYFTKMQRLPSAVDPDGYATLTRGLNVGW